jgi:hypothetical protein
MFTGESLVSLFFRLLNFIILGGAGIYFFKRYGLPVVRQRIREREELITGLKDQRDSLKDMQRSLEYQSAEQKQLSAQLTHKIGRWQHSYERQEHRRHEEKQRLITLLNKRTHQQSQGVALNTLQQQTFPLIIAASREQLVRQFTSAQQGQAYLQNLLKFMQKGKL